MGSVQRIMAYILHLRIWFQNRSHGENQAMCPIYPLTGYAHDEKQLELRQCLLPARIDHLSLCYPP